jgi:ribosomal protein S18 acetylase RimI-like enzyme
MHYKISNGEKEPFMKTQDNEDPASKRKKPDIEIREMEIEDLAAVFNLGEKLFQAREVPNLYRTWDEYEVVDFFGSDSSYAYVAEMDGDIVGFTLGYIVTKRNSAWKYGYLVWLGVEPELQRSGIATKLYKEIRDAMLEEGVRIVFVDTEADNTDALDFFTRMGFGKPEEHLYLSLNVDDKLRESRRKNGNNRHRKNGRH